MPFPLAHPAAVLPLRRFCPRFLNFPALVIGSICPDFGYFFGRAGVDEFSHSLLGTLGFSLPVGMLALGLCNWVSALTSRCFPGFYQRTILPFCQTRQYRIPAIMLSLVLGSLTHVLLDSLTHRQGWLAGHLPGVEAIIATFHGRSIRVCHLLWYGCSFLGMAWLFLAFRGWQETEALGRIATAWPKRIFEALLVASLLLPIEILHYLVRGKFGLLLVAVLSLAWIVVIALKVSTPTALAPPGNLPSAPAQSPSSDSADP